MATPLSGFEAAIADRYRIERELGAGGMAIVYLAEDLKHNRRVAVKVLKPELASTLGPERFLREIQIAATLNHPHILPLLDSGEAAGFLFYVMPYVEGESLRERLVREQELPVPEAARILKEVVDALAHAHDHGVVHRDVKPENVMLSGRHALVTDFGVAKAVSDAVGSSQLTSAGFALGTPAYMSPEQATGDPKMDHRADIYSVGVLAYELLAGQPPFEGMTSQQVLGAHLSQAPEPVIDRRASVPEKLAFAVMRCMEKLPADRWQTAEDLLHELETYTTPVATQPVTPPPVNVGVVFGVIGAALLGVAYGLIRWAGLPEWFFLVALALLAIGVPVTWLTLQQERLRVAGKRGPSRWFTWQKASVGGVMAFAAWGVVAAGWMVWGGSSARAVERQSIAVLQFETRSAGDDENSLFFAEGVHEDLLTQLSKIGDLKVISRTSALRYRGTDKTIAEIADELKVATVLAGNIRRDTGTVRIHAELIDARTNESLWVDTYNRPLTAANIFAIQSDVARNIAGALQATLAPEVTQLLAKRPTESLEAYDLYIRGRYVLNNQGTTREGVRRALALFEQATEMDSLYAPAYAGIANAHWMSVERGYSTGAEAIPRAKAAVLRALELDADLAEAHASYGMQLEAELRFDEADREFRRALELKPGSADIHRDYGFFLVGRVRDEEAIHQMRRAVELDPFAVVNRRGLVSALFYGRHFEETVEEARELAEIEPDFPDAYYFSGLARAALGEYRSALLDLERAIELNATDPYYLTSLAWVQARAGQRNAALQSLERARAQEAPIKEIALVYGALGDFDRAFQELERAYEGEPESLVYLDADPAADPLRSDPRFEALLAKLKTQ